MRFNIIKKISRKLKITKKLKIKIARAIIIEQ
jgi:hypothetical protein